MAKIEFQTLDSMGKRAVYRLADEADTLTTWITDAASNIGEIYEALAFMNEYPKGCAAHAILADRLRLGGKSDESIMACIERAAPTYPSIADRAEQQLDDLLADLRGVAGC